MCADRLEVINGWSLDLERLLKSYMLKFPVHTILGSRGGSRAVSSTSAPEAKHYQEVSAASGTHTLAVRHCAITSPRPGSHGLNL